MYMSKILPAALLAAVNLPSAMAAKCAAVGTIRVWYSGSAQVEDSIVIRDENKKELYSGKDRVCSDLTTITAADMGLENDFVWAASCNGGDIRECHGSSGAQTHIDGNEPGEGDFKFYGIASSTSSSCMVEFNC